jgi:N-acetylmuramoyl-L-alanine amidase
VDGRILSDDDLAILCIFAEARGEPYEGQVAVANVIRHRTAKKYFSDGTVTSTVTWPHQFSWMNTQDKQRCRVLSACWNEPGIKSAEAAWHESARTDEVPEALMYHADYVDPWWAKAEGIELVKRIGRHLFYRRK